MAAPLPSAAGGLRDEGSAAGAGGGAEPQPSRRRLGAVPGRSRGGGGGPRVMSGLPWGAVHCGRIPPPCRGSSP